MRKIGYALAPVLAVAALAAVTACGPSSGKASSDSSAAAAKASSVAANPTVSADVSALETELTACLQKQLPTVHPVKAVQATIHCAFPAGGTAAIESYAAKTFTPAALKAGAARQKWIAGIAGFAIAQGATASPSPAAESPSAVPSPAAS